MNYAGRARGKNFGTVIEDDKTINIIHDMTIEKELIELYKYWE